MTTPDLLNALADVLDGIAKVRAVAIFANEDEAEHSLLRLGDAGDAVSIALGLLPEATWQETATALRARATALTPGLPEGWAWIEGSTTEAQSAAGDFGVHIVGLTVYIDGEAPAQAVRAVLARAGVGS
jgi:hypothetical protein